MLKRHFFSYNKLGDYMKKHSKLAIILILIISLITVSIHINAIQENNQLFGMVYYIDAGHGGRDNGAGVDSVLEDEINLLIAGYLFEELTDRGAYVLLTRTDDYDLASLYDKNRKRKDLLKRVENINNSKPDLFISIHLNTFPSASVNGGQVFYKRSSDESKLVAESIQTELNDLSNKNKTVKTADYYLLEKTDYQGVIVECGFLTNPTERDKLTSEKYQRLIAKAITKGIVQYYLKAN